MTDLDAWWSKLNKDDQTLFVAHRNTSPLPVDVAARAAATGGATVPVQGGAAVSWAGPTQVFLSGKAS